LPLNKIDENADSISATEQEHLVDLVDVELGQEYELVVTTYAGKISILFNVTL
jgi:auxin responsive GH3 family protein